MPTPTSSIGLLWPQVATGTPTGGDWVTTLPLANLNSTRITKVARSVDATLAKTQWVEQVPLAAQGIFLKWCNLSSAAQLRLSVGTTSGASDLYAGGWVDYFRFTPASGITARQVDGMILTPTEMPANAWWKLEIDDTANADGYVEIGHRHIAPLWQPAISASYGLQDSVEDLSEDDASDGGDECFVDRENRRVVQLVMEILTASEGAILHDMQRTLGKNGHLYYLPNAADLAYSQRYGFLARQRELSPLEYPHSRTRRLPMRLTERL